MPLDLTTNTPFLRNIQIYENEKQFYFIGSHNKNKTLLIFTINKLRFSNNNTGTMLLQDVLIEHKKEYDKKSFDDLIIALSKDSKTQLRLVEEVKCIFGFVKFYFGHYAILVTEISRVGKIGDYVINRVDKVKLLPLFLVNNTNVYLEQENKYLTIFKNFDPSKQIYFSFTYDLTKTLQRNFVEKMKKEGIKDYDKNFYIQNKQRLDLKKVTNNTFLWNHYHIKEFYNVIMNKIWVAFFIYGFFEQMECMNYGLRFLVTVVARRNRHFAGTRYLKRGINDDGNVANDVETEQILEEISTSCAEKPVISSYIHIRGSVPIYWYQEQNGILPKPDIKVNYSDVFYETTKKHFYLLNKRYGKPMIVCNLTKKKEGDHKQEELLNESYAAGVEYINYTLNDSDKIIYLHFDLKNERRQAKFYRHFYEISYGLIEKTNMFSFIPQIRNNGTYMLELQHGVIRSNCVDCLDRTNVFQQVIGTAVMVNQLRAMGVNAKEPNNEEEMFGILTELYKNMGHELSSQYAGSLAHKQTIKDNRNKMNKFIDKFPELFNTFKRYFNNSFNDQYKQASINLFLGRYKVGKHDQHLWDLMTDIMLHRRNTDKQLAKLKEDWAKEANSYYETYNLITDLYEEYLNYISNNNMDTDESNINPNIEINLFDFISITKTKSTFSSNHLYSVNISKLPAYKKKINYQKITNEVDSFNNLDIDMKNHIKDFHNFNYNQLYENYINTNSNHHQSTTVHHGGNNINFRSTIIENDLLPDCDCENQNNFDIHTSPFIYNRYKTRSHPVNNSSHNRNIQNPLSQSTTGRKIKKRQAEWTFKKPQAEENGKVQKQTNLDRPKYDLKITSFEMDANEINLVNEFVDPDPKYLQNSEYHQLDYFLNMDINNDNYNKVFDSEVFDDKYDSRLDSTNINQGEFVEDFLQKFNNSSYKKKEHKLRELKNVDYLIYDVTEKQFYKKLKWNDEDIYEVSIGNGINRSTTPTQSTSSNKLFKEDSPKVKVKVKKLPIKIFEDHI